MKTSTLEVSLLASRQVSVWSTFKTNFSPFAPSRLLFSNDTTCKKHSPSRNRVW